MRLSLRGAWIAAGVLLLVAATVTWAAADKVVYRAVQQWDVTQDVPCVGTLDLSFVWRLHVIQGTDGNGGFHFNFHGNVSKFRAEDQDGNVYSGSQTVNENFYVAPGGFPDVHSVTQNLSAVGHGGAPNLIVRERYQVTVNAPGEVTVDRYLLSIECQ